MKRGEVRWCTFRYPDKKRPVLILTRDAVITVLSGITVAPVTKTVRHIPTQVLLTPENDDMPMVSAINLDNIQTVQKPQVGALITVLKREQMAHVERAICFSLGMDALL
jgi:mRNA interferase MazF